MHHDTKMAGIERTLMSWILFKETNNIIIQKNAIYG